MPTASEILSAYAPAFDGEASRTTHLSIAESCTSPTYFGVNRPLAVALRAAHALCLASGSSAFVGGASGPIASKSEGDLSVSYAQAKGGNGSDIGLDSTPYGKELQSLIRRSGAGVQVTGIPFVLGRH